MSQTTLKTFPNPSPNRTYKITHKLPEFFTSCPENPEGEYASLEVTYTPNEHCLEFRSLADYWRSFQHQEIYYELTINRFYNEILNACNPHHLQVTGQFKLKAGGESMVRVGASE